MVQEPSRQCPVVSGAVAKVAGCPLAQSSVEQSLVAQSSDNSRRVVRDAGADPRQCAMTVGDFAGDVAGGCWTRAVTCPLGAFRPRTPRSPCGGNHWLTCGVDPGTHADIRVVCR